MSTAPSTLMPAFVTRPAKPNVRPNASTSGHAVGAGNCRTSSETFGCSCWSFIAIALCLFLSAANDVDDGKDHYPDSINKVPIEREHPELFRVLTFQLPGKGKDQHQRKHGESNDHVARMQTNQGVVRSAEKIGADGQPIVINQLLPFKRGAAQ